MRLDAAFSRWNTLRRILAPLRRFVSPAQPAHVLVEDMLKILLVEEANVSASGPADLALKLGCSTAQIEAQLQRMLDAGLVVRTDHVLQLTLKGRRDALRVLRAHRLWELYLADESGYPQSEWHTRAEQEEHRLSVIETEALAARLDHPTVDPHGDPIPSDRGTLGEPSFDRLADCVIGSKLKIVHIEDEPGEIYQEAVDARLYPGAELEIIGSNDQGISVLIAGKQRRLSHALASNIQSRPIEFLEDASLPLSSLKVGGSGWVVRLAAPLRGPTRRRLLDLGLLPGTLVRAEFSSPAGDPTAYRVRGALIALRTEQTDWIMVAAEPPGNGELPMEFDA